MRGVLANPNQQFTVSQMLQLQALQNSHACITSNATRFCVHTVCDFLARLCIIRSLRAAMQAAQQHSQQY